MQSNEKAVSDAMRAHRAFLQEVLAEVMKILEIGQPSDERLIKAMESYWEACYARRAVRRGVVSATKGTSFEQAVEPMGKPFLLMVRAELVPKHPDTADELSQRVYDTARAIS